MFLVQDRRQQTTAQCLMRITYIDHARSTCLCQAGLPGYAAVVAIDSDGGTDLVLIDQSALGCESHNSYNPTTPQAPHEQAGPLPPRWRDRVQLAPLRCGRRTKSGTSCRAYVARPGHACGWHREQDALDLLAEQLGAKPVDLDGVDE
jgi:hypothetical protein